MPGSIASLAHQAALIDSTDTSRHSRNNSVLMKQFARPNVVQPRTDVLSVKLEVGCVPMCLQSEMGLEPLGSRLKIPEESIAKLLAVERG